MTARQWALRGLLVLLPQLVPVAEAGAGAEWTGWFSLLLLVAGLVAAWLPDSQAGLVVLVVGGGHWIVVDDQASAWALLAAVGLLGFHLAAQLAASGPAYVDLPRALLVMWARRSGLALAAGVATWGAVRLAARADVVGSVVSFSVGLAVLGLWLGLVARRTRMERW